MIDIRHIRNLAKKYDIEEAIWSLPEDDLVKKVREFTLEGEEVPFFSEAKLYKLVGKENARTILYYINKLVENQL